VLPRKLVHFDAFPDSPFRHRDRDAVVCIDVFRASTTLVTAVAQGRTAYPAGSAEQARAIARGLKQPLLAGESGGEGFDLANSPAALAARTDVERPLVLASSIGTELIVHSAGCRASYVACFRNLEATAAALSVAGHRDVALLAAGSRGQLRCEDQMAAAWLAARLLRDGFEPADRGVEDLVRRFAGVEPSLARWGNSAEWLRRHGFQEDIDFTLARIDDLDLACVYAGGAVVADPAPARVFRLARFAGAGLPASLPAEERVASALPSAG
jgi:2-phosphosulfolactate phosphatase